MLRAAFLVGAILAQAAPLTSRIPVFAAPVKEAVPPSPAQVATLRAGVALHNQQRFDEAVAQFDAVLKENPDSVPALYESAYSLYEKHDYERAFDRAVKCTEYVGPLLAQCYSVIGGILEASNAATQAIDVYKKGLEFAPSALLYYNMAVTYQNALKNSPAAKEALKKASFLDPNHANTQWMLGRLLLAGGYRTLALAALSRFLVLEPASPRTPQAFNAWMAVLSGGVHNQPTARRRWPSIPTRRPMKES
jgi:tetratricopeptide (TPR) repeat protein